MNNKKRTATSSSVNIPVHKADDHLTKRPRKSASPVKTLAPSLADPETELLRALEEEISKEEQKEEENKTDKLPFQEEDDDYDESDGE
ncbi:hypothetical protein P3T76_008961 [Phytophthora citrophthora]|uniref:Uncharacterized protein n=1 Tax=Phytophthora citrophthora TaxID=4793 RepID=A0AAD9LJT9_9STRA|nr:hypothetical protein P3T76_008961 [Phytophthora citrophthora]